MILLDRLILKFIDAYIKIIQDDDDSGCCWGLYGVMLELCGLIVKFVRAVPKFM